MNYRVIDVTKTRALNKDVRFFAVYRADDREPLATIVFRKGAYRIKDGDRDYPSLLDACRAAVDPQGIFKIKTTTWHILK